MRLTSGNAPIGLPSWENVELMCLRVFKPFSAIASVLVVLLVLFPQVIRAQGIFQGISGLLEFDYSSLSSKTKADTGATIKTDTSSYNPRFTLNIDTKIFPNLKLLAGGIAELIKSDLEANRIETKTTVTKFRPYINLTLETPLYTAGLGYIMRREKTDPEHSPSVTLVNEEYNGLLGWRPEGLPQFEMRLRRTSEFDEGKVIRDIKEDYAGLTAKYGYKGLQVNYNGTYTHSKDHLNNLDTELLNHNGRIAYGGSFLKNRVTVNTTYDFSQNQVKTLSEGTGAITLPVFPFAGLSKIDDTLPPLTLALDPNPALVDGDTTASSGIDLISNVPLTRRQLGLDFLNPAEVNQLFIWVDQDLSAAVAGSFLWNVYISQDNLNWTHHAGPITASFGTFQNRFEINFPAVIPARRYIKVVTTPLFRTPLVPPNIFVTELEAFISRPATQGQEKIKRTSHTYNLDAKARILNTPLLLYDFYYFFNSVDPDNQKRYDFSNGLSVSHQFSKVFSGTARVAREDGEERDEKRVTYVYNASITADPLKTLHTSLVFSGRDEEINNKPNNNNSLFLYSTAQLYQGIDLNLNGGVSYTKQETDEKGRDIVIDVGLNIVPHPNLILGLNYSNTWSRVSGGERESSSSDRRRVDLSVNFNPFRTVHLYASLEWISGKGVKTVTNQNYAINWSPFPDGALQFFLSYDENLRPEDGLKERIFIPSVRYKLGRRSYIDLSYQMTQSDSQRAETKSQVISSNLKIFF